MAGQAQMTQLGKGKPNVRKRRRRPWGRHRKSPVRKVSMYAAHGNASPMWQPTSKPNSVSLSTPAQHRLLVGLQGILEVACYDYTKRALPNTIKRKGWDCAESVELNQWTFEMRKLNLFDMKGSDYAAMAAMLHSVANVRHTAVHRRRVGVVQIDRFFTDALGLLGFFEDEQGRRAVVALRQEARTLLSCGTKE